MKIKKLAVVSSAILLIIISTLFLQNCQALGAQEQTNAYGFALHYSGHSLYANETQISTTITIIHSNAENRYYYNLDYETQLVFDYPFNLTVYVPLATGSIIDLKASVNDKQEEHPSIYNNELKLSLNKKDRPHTIKISYRAYGLDYYSHEVPTDQYIENFQMDIDIVNHIEDPSLGEDCLSPDQFTIATNTTSYSWVKKDAVLKEQIKVNIPTPKTVTEQVEEPEETEPNNEGINWLVITVMITSVLVIILTIFFIRIVLSRMKTKRLQKEITTINKKLTKQKERLSKKSLDLERRFCPFCQTKVSSEFHHCPQCGSKVDMISKCDECGSINLKDGNLKYCPNCGT